MKLKEIIAYYPYRDLDLHEINFSTESGEDVNLFCHWLASADITIVRFRPRRSIITNGIDLASIAPEIIINIFKAIAANSTIEELDLLRCNLGDIRNPDLLEAMFKALGTKEFTSISVAHNRLRSASMMQLKKWAAVKTKKLYLSGSSLASVDVKELWELLTVVNDNEKLEELYLDRCELGRALYPVIDSYTHPNSSPQEIEELQSDAQARMEELWAEFIRVTALNRLDISYNELPEWFDEEMLKIRGEHNPNLKLDVDEYRYDMPLVPAVAAAADRLSTGSSSTQQASSTIASDTDSSTTVAATMLFSKMAIEFAQGAGRTTIEQDDDVSEPILTKPSSPLIHG